MQTFIQFLVVGIAFGSIVGLCALGLAVSYWPSRQVHFGYALVILGSAYGYRAGTAVFNLGALGGIVVGFAVATIVGVGCYTVVYRHVKVEFSVFLAGFAVLVLGENITQLIFSSSPLSVSLPAWFGETAVFGGVHVSNLQIVEVCCFLLLWGGVALYLKRSLVGAQLRAIAGDRYLSICVGIPVDRRIKQSYVIGSVIGAVAGILLAVDQAGVTTTMGENPLFYALSGVLIGGTASISGAALGGWIIGFVIEVGVWKLSPDWQVSIAFIVLIAVVVLKPQGLFGTTSRKV